MAVPFLLGTFLLLAFYAAALGVKFSLRCRSSLRAMGATLAVGLVAGGGYLFCCMPLAVAGSFAGRGPGQAMELVFAPCIPMLLALPGIIAVEGEQFFRNEEGGIMLFAYILGMIGYAWPRWCWWAAASAVLTLGTGRTRRHPRLPNRLSWHPWSTSASVGLNRRRRYHPRERARP